MYALMFLSVLVAAIAGLLVGASGCYIVREAYIQKQLRQVLAVMETEQEREDISLPISSQLRRRAAIVQQQQQELERQLFSWQSLLQVAPIGYIQVDGENQILWCNQVAQELLHIQKWEPGQARLLLELVRSYELDRSIQKARSSQVAQQLIWQFYFGYQEAADAQSVWLNANIIPLTGGAVGVFIEDRQTQIEAATARERWLADLAHEIRTPLTAIRLVSETLQTKVAPDLTRWVDRMLLETNRTIDLVEHFLEISQLETDPSQYLQLVKVNFIESIEDAWHTIEPIASQRQIEFIYTGPDRSILQIDRSRFTQVFTNLFDNSIKHCLERGKIWIDVHPLDRDGLTDRITIDFYDDGEGFATSDLPYVFDRLYRGDPSRKRPALANVQTQLPRSEDRQRMTGSGLGLAIVRQIVLAHGGTITADNHPDTKGAWIQIVLPNN
jgi:two-component system, OmpR family, phosphate regulon sensor histidine kinase PhoR